MAEKETHVYGTIVLHVNNLICLTYNISDNIISLQRDIVYPCVKYITKDGNLQSMPINMDL
jgi:hypothetical protein